MTEAQLAEANGLVARYRKQRFASPTEALAAYRRLTELGVVIDMAPVEDDGA